MKQKQHGNREESKRMHIKGDRNRENTRNHNGPNQNVDNRYRPVDLLSRLAFKAQVPKCGSTSCCFKLFIWIARIRLSGRDTCSRFG